jgi:light-regulated signal transduction histidine kinase (bacteriophytochrome)
MASTSQTADDPLTTALARVAELEAELQASQRSAQSANQELQHFVYAASHDLQEPLRAITTYSQLLARLYSNDAEARELTEFITSGVTRMNGLLQNLVAYSRVNQSPVLSSVKLGSAVQATIFKLANAIKESGAVIRCADLPEIPAHEVQVCQLFEHILSNSLIYRRRDKPEVEISAEEGELDGDPAQIVKIRDNGVGIEQQFLMQVIQPFKRLHGKEFPGNGLGLAICDKIMRAHKGKLWIESDGSSWTAVHLAFPY